VPKGMVVVCRDKSKNHRDCRGAAPVGDEICEEISRFRFHRPESDPPNYRSGGAMDRSKSAKFSKQECRQRSSPELGTAAYSARPVRNETGISFSASPNTMACSVEKARVRSKYKRTQGWDQHQVLSQSSEPPFTSRGSMPLHVTKGKQHDHALYTR
jgi:hypothetical protein